MCLDTNTQIYISFYVKICLSLNYTHIQNRGNNLQKSSIKNKNTYIMNKTEIFIGIINATQKITNFNFNM